MYAELCNALYVREVKRLALEPDAERLRRLLSSLPFYIERAAHHIVTGNAPLTLDSQNGSWLAKQATHAPLAKADAAALFYKKPLQLGLVVPVLLFSASGVTVRIDSLDRRQSDKLHCNEHGWFALDGRSLQQQDACLLKPDKSVMTAACCGHRWQNDKRVAPRLLSLREMLLASRIDWRNFARPRLTDTV